MPRYQEAGYVLPTIPPSEEHLGARELPKVGKKTWLRSSSLYGSISKGRGIVAYTGDEEKE